MTKAKPANKRTEKTLWGEKYHVAVDADIVVDKLQIVAGGYSSRHYHAAKDNLFVLVGGVVQITEYHGDAGAVTVTLSADGPRVHSVPAKVVHRFRAVVASVLWEVYLRAADCELPLSQEDIVRYGTGGVDAVSVNIES